MTRRSSLFKKKVLIAFQPTHTKYKILPLQMPQLDIATFFPIIFDSFVGYNLASYFFFTHGGPELIFFLILFLLSCLKKNDTDKLLLN